MKANGFILAIGLSLSVVSIANASVCAPANATEMIEDLSKYIEANPSSEITIYAETVAPKQVLSTGNNGHLNVIAKSPYEVTLSLGPNSEMEWFEVLDKKCGPEVKLRRGSLRSIGKHPQNNHCNEVHTDYGVAIPSATSYLVQTGALNNALADLNNEMIVDGNITDTQENFSVSEGQIEVILKKVNKKGMLVKHTKASSLKKKRITKTSKIKSKMFAYKGKIKLIAGASLKIKRNRKLKGQVADLEVITPD